MTTTTYPAIVARQVADHARRDFMFAVERLLKTQDIAPEERAEWVRGTQEILANALRQMEWN